MPYFVDWDDYRAVFEEQLERVVGRKVSVGGKVNLTLLPVPELSFEKVRFAHAGGAFDDPFAEVESFAMALSLPALLSGRIEAKSVSLVSPRLRLNVDDKGQGNWTDIGTLDPSLPFVPRDVTLNAVVIENGAIEIVNVRSSLPIRIEAVNGEFSADSLKGPFRFTGSASLNGSRQEIRLAAGQVEAGASRIKATLRAASRGIQTQFDGDLTGFSGPLTFTGVMAVKMPLRRGGTNAQPDQPPPMLDITAKSLISPEKFELSEIAATLGDDIRPQTFTGRAVFALAGEARFDAEIETRWFDATPLAGDGDMARLLGNMRLAMAEVVAALPVRDAEGRLAFRAEQIGISGETLRNAEIAIETRPGAYPAITLKALVPGETALSLSGTLEDEEGSTTRGGFAGRMDLSGANLSRFSAWAGLRGKPETTIRPAAQPFTLGADIRYAGQELRLDSLRGDVAGSKFSGAFRYAAGERRTLDLTLESESLDMQDMFAGGLTLEDLLANSPPGDPGSGQPGSVAHSPLGALLEASSQMVEMKLSLRLGRVAMPGRTLDDVRAALTIRDGVLDISTLQLASSDGLRLAMSGALKSYAETPDGDIRLSLDAASPDALAMLLNFGRIGGDALQPSSLAPSAPLKLTGNLTARGEARLLDFKLDGLAADSPFSLAGRYESGKETFWGGSIDAEGWISNASGGVLLSQLLPGRRAGGRSIEAGGQSLFTVALKGPVEGQLDINAALRSPLVSASFEGRTSLISAHAGTQGRLRLDSASAEATAALAAAVLAYDLPVPKRFSLEADLSRTGDTYSLSGLNASIDGAPLRGSLKATTGDGAPVLTADIETGEASLPVLLSVLIDKSGAATGAGEAAADDAGFWSEKPFSKAAFSGAPQSLRLRAGKLRLADGLTLENATLNASLGRNAFSLAALEGTLFGGRFSARALLETEKGRFALKSRLSLDDADLGEALKAGMRPLAKGRLSASLRLEGEGLSPRGLVSTLSGTGRIGFGDGLVYGLDPGAPETVVQRHMDGQAFDQDAFRKQLAKAIRAGDFGFRRLRAPVRVRNGIAQIRRASLRGKEHTTRAILALDLARLHADLELQIGIASTRKRTKLPPVSMVFAGPLPAVLEARGELDSSDLERYLAVRRMERDVETLEKLNKTGRLPFPVVRGSEAAKPEAVGPRIEKADPSGTGPRIRQPAGLDVERRALPSLPEADAPAAPLRPSWTAAPQSETANPMVIEKTPGEFEAKIRAAIQKGGGAPKPADGGSAAPPEAAGGEPAVIPPLPEKKPLPPQKAPLRASPGEPFAPFAR